MIKNMLTTEQNTNREQERYEIVTWLRMLDYQQQENIFVKNRIAEIAKRNIPKEVLERLEYYLSLFLNKDALIVLLRRDIAQLSEAVENGKTVQTDVPSLRKDLQRLEQEFSTLRAEFNSYLLTTFNS